MRKAQAKIREVQEDPTYKSKLVTKIINRSMKDGKRSIAQKNVYTALETAGREIGENPLKVLIQAVNNIKPDMEVRPRRIGGAAYQVPAQVRGPRRESLAIRWMILAAESKPNSQFKTFAAKLAAEIADAYRGEGGAVTKRQQMEHTAEANKAFSHFRW